MYKQKYLKYKNKYLSLKKNQYGGDEIDDEIKRLEDIEADWQERKILRKQIDILYETKREKILKPFNNCTINSIEIDDYIFSLLAYDSTPYDNRGILIIKSINKINYNEKLFPVYSSKSEGGFWRLCMADKYGKLNKGNVNTQDYIQGTFIHLKLQQFINNNIDKCPQQEIGNKCFFTEDSYMSYIDKQVNDSKRQVEITPFSEYKSGPSNMAGARDTIGNKWNINGRLLELSKKLRTLSGFKIKEFILEDTYSKINNIDGDILKIDGKIIKCVFENNIFLYMLKYILNVKRIDNTEYNKNGICPIVMVSNSSKITEFGIYSDYVPAGNYIGKLFEYGIQIAGDKTYTYENLGSSYLYIGSHYDGVYPYTELRSKF